MGGCESAAKWIKINALYRPPNQTSNDHELFLDTAQDILEKLNEYKKASLKLITGDLNFSNIYCKNIELRPKPSRFSSWRFIYQFWLQTADKYSYKGD